MKIVLCKSSTVGSWLIRALTWSAWSHVAILNGEQAIEAVFPAVQLTTLAEIQAKHHECLIVDLECGYPEEAWAAAMGQVGAPYDWRGLIGLPLQRAWATPGRWWCSELVAWALAQGCSPKFRDEALNRITPQNIWELPPRETI